MEDSDDIKERLEYAKKYIIPDMADIILRDHGKDQKSIYKNDYTLPTDKFADDKFYEKLMANFQYDSVLSEERSKLDENIKGKNKYQWIVDPLDGTNNYGEKTNPYFAISAALKEGEELKGGLVYHVMENRLYHCQKSKKAYMNDKQIHVSDTKDFGKARISLIADSSFKKHDLGELLKTLKKKIKKKEMLKCTALELAGVASGEFDGVVKPTKNPWGVSAGLLLVKEAGGKVTEYRKQVCLEGKDPYTVNIYVASNPHIHKDLCSIVDSYLGKEKEK